MHIRAQRPCQGDEHPAYTPDGHGPLYLFVVCRWLCAGKQDLEVKLGAVRLVSEYVDVVLWFVVSGLLPEHPGLSCLFIIYLFSLGGIAVVA